MFKVGDSIVCRYNNGVAALTINKSYVINKLTNDGATVVICNNYEQLDWYMSTRFESSVKQMRKEKLLKICSKKEIK